MFRLLMVGLLIIGAPFASAVEVIDAEGDVQLESADGSKSPAPNNEDTDILRVWMQEDSNDTISAGVVARGSLGNYPTGGQVPNREVHFGFDGVEYKTLHHSLYVYNEAADLWREIADLERLEGGGDIIPKNLIRDSQALPIHVGQTLENIRAVAYSYPAWPDQSNRLTDQAPDEGVGPSLDILQGPGDLGDLIVSSAAPTRSSNGGPDLFAYPVRIDNRADEGRMVFVDIAGAPETWDVRTPEILELPRGVMDFPVFVSTGGGHQHGETIEFEVEFHDENGQELGAYPLALHYLTIPQLAGHHPMLFMHTGNPASGTIDSAMGWEPVAQESWFNTLQKDNEDDGYGIGGEYLIESGSTETVEWAVPMDPSLLIGMDFELNQEARFSVGLWSRAPATDATATINLLHCRPADQSGLHPSKWGCGQGSWFPLVEQIVKEFSLAPEKVEIIEDSTMPAENADLVPFESGSNVLLHVTVAGFNPGDAASAEEMRLFPAATWMELPLNEFQDPVDSAFEESGALKLDRISIFETHANPAQIHQIEYVVHDQLAPRELDLSVIGTNLDWVHAPNSVMTTEDGVTILLDVNVPTDAGVGDFAEFFLAVEPQDGNAMGAVSKARVVVVNESVVPQSYNNQEQDTPIAGVPVAILALMTLVIAGRRRNE